MSTGTFYFNLFVEPDYVRSKSGAAAGLCAWVINIIKYYEVYCDVEPKRRALEAANAELAAAQDKLLIITQKVTVSLEEQCGIYDMIVA